MAKKSKQIALKELAARQGGYFSAKQAIELGFGNNTHSHYCQTNQWFRIDVGIYYLKGNDGSYPFGELFRWAFWSRSNDGKPQGIICHESALHFCGLVEIAPKKVCLAVPADFRKNSPAVSIYKIEVPSHEIMRKGVLRIAKPGWVLAELKDDLSRQGIFVETVRGAIAAGYLTLPLARMRGWLPELQECAPKTGEMAMGELSERHQGKGGLVTSPVTGGYKFRREYGRMRGIQAFTLVELLVVIAIISILAALLLPTLSKARQITQSIACGSNLRQVGIAFQDYASDHRGALPFAYWVYLADNIELTWDDLLDHYLGGNLTDAQKKHYYSNVPKPLLVCPVDGVSHLRSYSANGAGVDKGTMVPRYNVYPAPPVFRLGRDITQPSGTILLLERPSDNQTLGNCSCCYALSPDQQESGIGAPAHNGKWNYLYCDTHISTKFPFDTVGTGTTALPKGEWTRATGD
jgi:prepilin-type N-terminal cleavage/methylation domain-containing protein